MICFKETENMNKLLRILILLGIFLGLGVSCASASNVVSFNPQTVELSPGSSQNVQIVMDEVPDGLSGFNITISVLDPEIAEITGVSFPSWGMMPRNSTIPSSSVWIKVSDLDKKVGSGDTNVLMGTITLTGKKEGTTDLNIPKTQISADGGSLINPVIVAGKIHVSDDESPVLPVANFSSNVTEGYAPLSVQFTDLSENAIEWKWDFGDGANSLEQSPIHTYSAAGVYTANLTVSNENGTNSKLATITVLEKSAPILPVANFSTNVSEGYAPLSVQFTDLSENAIEWKWDFDNNGVVDSTDRNPIYNYVAPGVYTANLTVSNTNGTNSRLATITVLEKSAPILPVANFSTNVSEGYAPLTVQFTDLSENATGWNWDFGDGVKDSENRNPIHEYVTPGVYTVNLTVNNANGTSSKLATITVSEKSVSILPVASFITNVSEGYAPLTVQFTDQSQNANGWSWDFGDGTSSTEQNPIHTYSATGAYSVSLTVSNPNGTNSTLANITVFEKVAPILPVANFSTDVSSGYAPLTVQFTDLSENATGCNWDFGDGTSSTEKNPIHTYSAAGNYTANLTVSNENGTASRSAIINVLKEPVLPPVADFRSDVTTGCVPLAVQFTDLSKYATEWKWDFGDGTSSTEQNPLHTYSAAGNYTVTLTVSNEAGTDTEVKAGYIIVNPVSSKLVAAFVASPTSGDVPLKVAFTDRSTGSPTSWKWSFGDGTYSTSRNPSHTYNKAGKYTVSLTVKNARGSNTVTKSQYISVTNSLKTPVACFSASPTSGYAPLKVAFTDRSKGKPTSWKWSFGDGTYSTAKTPVHTYSKAGKYTVSLTVKNSAGTSTITGYNYIKVVAPLKTPVAAFSAAPTSGKVPLKVQFTDRSSGSPTSWKWSFGDRTYSTAKNPSHTYSKAGKYTVSLTVKNAKGSNTKTIYGYITASKRK